MLQISLRPVDHEDPEPVYRQIAASIRDAITDRVYPAGGKLPSLRELCGHFGVAKATMNAALDVLTTERLVYSRQGSGWFVVTNSTAVVDSAHGARAIDDGLRQALHLLAHLDTVALKAVPAAIEEISSVLRQVQFTAGALRGDTR